jgi:hypothetical protein
MFSQRALLLRRVAYVCTGVSEDTAASIFCVAKSGSDGCWSNFDDEMFGLMYISEYPEDGDNTFLRNFKTNLLPYTV